MRNARMEHYPNIPNSLDELANILQDPQYSVISSTLDGLDNIFASFVEAADGTKIIILVSQRFLRLLERVSTVFCDGTFPTPVNPHVSQVSLESGNMYPVMTAVSFFFFF